MGKKLQTIFQEYGVGNCLIYKKRGVYIVQELMRTLARFDRVWETKRSHYIGVIAKLPSET